MDNSRENHEKAPRIISACVDIQQYNGHVIETYNKMFSQENTVEETDSQNVTKISVVKRYINYYTGVYAFNNNGNDYLWENRELHQFIDYLHNNQDGDYFKITNVKVQLTPNDSDNIPRKIELEISTPDDKMLIIIPDEYAVLFPIEREYDNLCFIKKHKPIVIPSEDFENWYTLASCINYLSKKTPEHTYVFNKTYQDELFTKRYAIKLGDSVDINMDRVLDIYHNLYNRSSKLTPPYEGIMKLVSGTSGYVLFSENNGPSSMFSMDKTLFESLYELMS